MKTKGIMTPSDHLRARGCARDFKCLTLKTGKIDLSKNEFSVLKKEWINNHKINSKLPDLNISENYWSEFWNGKRQPGSTTKRDIDNHLGRKLCSSWLLKESPQLHSAQDKTYKRIKSQETIRRDEICKNRLLRFFNALDLPWIYSNFSPKLSMDLCENIKYTISQCWILSDEKDIFCTVPKTHTHRSREWKLGFRRNAPILEQYECSYQIKVPLKDDDAFKICLNYYEIDIQRFLISLLRSDIFESLSDDNILLRQLSMDLMTIAFCENFLWLVKKHHRLQPKCSVSDLSQLIIKKFCGFSYKEFSAKDINCMQLINNHIELSRTCDWKCCLFLHLNVRSAYNEFLTTLSYLGFKKNNFRAFLIECYQPLAGTQSYRAFMVDPEHPYNYKFERLSFSNKLHVSKVPIMKNLPIL